MSGNIVAPRGLPTTTTTTTTRLTPGDEMCCGGVAAARFIVRVIKSLAVLHVGPSERALLLIWLDKFASRVHAVPEVYCGRAGECTRRGEDRWDEW